MKKYICIAAILLTVAFAGCGEIDRLSQVPAQSHEIINGGRTADSPAPPRSRTPRATPRQTPRPTPAPAAHSYQTEYDQTDSARAENLRLAANSINNMTVQPNEEFSFNDTIGSTTEEYGYQEAIVYAGGEKTKSYGGGVCQVSSTLCNAAIAAGMEITERHDHSLPVNYIGDGIEAATSNRGELDFRFTNPHPYPVIIKAQAENGVVRVSVSKAI